MQAIQLQLQQIQVLLIQTEITPWQLRHHLLHPQQLLQTWREIEGITSKTPSTSWPQEWMPWSSLNQRSLHPIFHLLLALSLLTKEARRNQPIVQAKQCTFICTEHTSFIVKLYTEIVALSSLHSLTSTSLSMTLLAVLFYSSDATIVAIEPKHNLEKRLQDGTIQSTSFWDKRAFTWHLLTRKPRSQVSGNKL